MTMVSIDEHRDQTNHCIACREPIRPGASLCPHCNSPQNPFHLKAFGSALKWVGGAVTVVSLVSAVISLNGVYKEWNGKQEAVAEIVTSARWLQDSHSYPLAWQQYQQALSISPGSPAARAGQVELALEWIRNVNVIDKQTFSSVVDVLLPILHRGLNNADRPRTATLLAHVGWGYYLKNRDVRVYDAQIERAFAKAFEYDADNTYANSMYGFWLMFSARDVNTAIAHFNRALTAGGDHQWSRRMQLNGLAAGAFLAQNDTPERMRPFAQELIKAAQQMRINSETLSARARDDILRCLTTLYSLDYVDSILASLPDNDFQSTLVWLIGATESKLSLPVHKAELLLARILERQGHTSKALETYRKLSQLGYSRPPFKTLVQDGIERLGKGTGASPPLP